MASNKGHFLAGKKIMVAGAGMAGLSFAIALRKQWPSGEEPPRVTLYDRDTRDISTKREGYSLSLSALDENGGLVALKDLGVLDRILGRAVTGLDGAGGFRMWANDWSELLRIDAKPHAGLPTAAIRIARRDLRRVLLDAAEAAGADIVWGTQCVAAERLPGDRVRVRLLGPDGAEADEECDLLVAADGAHSKIRASVRPADTLDFANAIQIGGQARFPDGIPPPVDESWGLMISGENLCCFYSPVDKHNVVWALGFTPPDGPREVERDLSEEQFQALMRECLEKGHMFQEPFPTLVRHTVRDTAFAFNARDKKPFAHRGDESLRGIVFLGDANHAVSPYAGNGANMALKDGWDLAAVLSREASLDAAVARYDKLSLPRASATLKSSRRRIMMGHCTGLLYVGMRTGLLFARTMMKLSGKS